MTLILSYIDEVKKVTNKLEITKISLDKEDYKKFLANPNKIVFKLKNLETILFNVYEKEIDSDVVTNINNKFAKLQKLHKMVVICYLYQITFNFDKKYKKFYVVSTFINDAYYFSNIKYLHLNGYSLCEFGNFHSNYHLNNDKLEELKKFKCILQNLSNEIENLQITISHYIYSIANFDFNLPISLKNFNLTVLDYFPRIYGFIDINKIKIPFNTNFTYNIQKYNLDYESNE